FIDAQTALNWGLVTDLVEPEQLLEKAKTTLNLILSMAPLAISGVMEVIDYGYDMSLTDALHLEVVHFAKVCASKDKVEGVDAFLNKRAAVFKGE
ncbi:MAG: enoyl-CoA hydratase, partial [Legionella sp.]